MQKPKHIVLLGASVGKAWNVEELPARLMNSASFPLTPNASRLTAFPYRFEYVGKGQFDKTDALQQLLSRKEDKPDAIFLKECAAYFPGDLSQYKVLMTGWVQQCRSVGVTPIPTTVVPVVRDLSWTTRLKDLIKWVIGRPTFASQLTQIAEYNDWIKALAPGEGLAVLDIEAPLRISPQDRSLRPDLTSGDGLHLNDRAYVILDKIVIPTLEKAFDKRS